MSSWTRTAARANNRRAEKKLLAADRKRRQASGQKAVSRKTVNPATGGSIVSRVAALKEKAAQSKARKAARTQIIAAPPEVDYNTFIVPEMVVDIPALTKEARRERIKAILRQGASKGNMLENYGGYSVKQS